VWPHWNLRDPLRDRVFRVADNNRAMWNRHRDTINGEQ